MTARVQSIKEEDISTLLREVATSPSQLQTIHPLQVEHRLELARRFFAGGADDDAPGLDIDGKRVLEVGAGQGDMSIVLADLVGGAGSVVAIDPAPLTYGAPLTLGQAQAMVKSTKVGSRIDFVRADAPTYFSSGTQEAPFHTAVLAHCLFYFASEQALKETLVELRRDGRVQHLCLAEWSLTASVPSAYPHLLSILAQAFLPEADANIRTIFSPEQIKRLAAKAGWTLRQEGVLRNPPIQDGRWEIETVFYQEAEYKKKKLAGGESAEPKDVTTFSSFCDSIRAHLPTPGSTKGVTCVDVWTGVFDAATS